MTKDYPGEQWKTVQFDFEFTNDFRLEVSNFGRLKTFNKIHDGNLLKGSMVNGYRILRLKLYRPRPEKDAAKLERKQAELKKLSAKLRTLKAGKAPAAEIKEAEALLADFRSKLTKKFKADLKNRAINYHSLVHRLVATYFLPKPKADQTVVAHIDHNKLNNRSNNLKWMTAEENYAHQQKSPLVIAEKDERSRLHRSGNTKLTEVRVMYIKKLLKEGKTLKQLAKQFKVSDMQIHRIKSGENWGNVPAAK